MKTTVILPIAALFSIAAVHAQGPLTPPPGAPAPVMKSLDQIEARTPLIDGAPGVTFSSGHYTITQPGSYYLTGNLTCTDTSGSNFINLAANNVTLDLNGFTISGTTANMGEAISGTGFGYRVCNGHIVGGTTQTGGAFTKAGFNTGIYLFTGSVSPGTGSIVTDVTVRGVRNRGIFSSSDSVVDRCVIDTTGEDGIKAGIVRACRVINVGGDAIQGVNISDCCGKSVGYGFGITYYYQTETSTVSNSVGVAVSGTGIYCSNAINCRGTSVSGSGLYSLSSATNCFGGSSSGPQGLYAVMATNCIGSRPSGTAITATVANGCFAQLGTNTITHKYNMP